MNQIKFIANSHYLGKELAKIDFAKDSVVSAENNDNEVILTTSKGEKLSLNVKVLTPNGTSSYIPQHDRRWDWIMHATLRVEKQPIVIQIFENVTNLIFQY